MDGLRPKKSQNNEFVESWLENWVLVNQTNTGKDSDDKRMKRKKVVLKTSSSAKSKEVCSFILLMSPITSLILEPILFLPFSSPFSRSPNLVSPFFFYALPHFHLHLPLVCSMVSADTCPISTSHKSSCSSCKAEIHCSCITSTLMQSES